MKPKKALKEFFEYTSLKDAQKSLKELLDVTVTGGFPEELDYLERCHVVYFIHQLEELVKAAYKIADI